MTKYGYARVSSKEQHLDRQIQQLQAAGITEIYQEKASGVNRQRPVLKQVIQKLTKTDELVVISLDRLSRDTDHLTQLMVQINLRQATLRVLDIPDFYDIPNQNIQQFMHNIVLEVKKFMAAEERTQLLTRQRQGIEIAKARGRYTGGQRLYTRDAVDVKRRTRYLKIRNMLQNNQRVCDIMRATGCSNTLVYRIKRELQAEVSSVD
ncbi:recombinase family protein [Companilactobacillus sp.]|uniref:recombinase family protein n=1 Tax=Companilactobacillus sp. TaxID=2767905 RepID=UPI00260460DB|nr:recombinase family protein [Companilactobacillus sp.]